MKRIYMAIDVPDSADPDHVAAALHRARIMEEGITITTASRLTFDVDLVRVREDISL